MWSDNQLVNLLGITYPLIQAPMAGGATPPKLVAAVSNSGGLGSLGAGYLSPAQLRAEIKTIRQLTERPFAVNLFIPEPATVTPGELEATNRLMQPYYAELGVAVPPPVAEQYAQPFDEQMAVIMEEAVPVFSFTFGNLSPEWLDRLKGAGVVVMGTATTVAEAQALAEAGVTAIVAQGSEAGGHRGTFLGMAEAALIGTMALVPAIVDQLSVPVVAAGGIMDGRGLTAALALGAAGVQMGTAFLTCRESGAHAEHKAAILHSTEDSTVLTRAFSGKLARGIKNRFISEMQPHETVLPAYPIQNSLTKVMRRTAGQQNRPELMSLWAGQGTRLSTAKSAAELVSDVITQAESVLSRLA